MIYNFNDRSLFEVNYNWRIDLSNFHIDQTGKLIVFQGV